jgi:hypothetical protein
MASMFGVAHVVGEDQEDVWRARRTRHQAAQAAGRQRVGKVLVTRTTP